MLNLLNFKILNIALYWKYFEIFFLDLDWRSCVDMPEGKYSVKIDFKIIHFLAHLLQRDSHSYNTQRDPQKQGSNSIW